jgi:hypothetical protein
VVIVTDCLGLADPKVDEVMVRFGPPLGGTGLFFSPALLTGTRVH